MDRLRLGAWNVRAKVYWGCGIGRPNRTETAKLAEATSKLAQTESFFEPKKHDASLWRFCGDLPDQKLESPCRIPNSKDSGCDAQPYKTLEWTLGIPQTPNPTSFM